MTNERFISSSDFSRFSFVVSGIPLTMASAHQLGLSGIRIDDICEGKTPTRPISGIATYPGTLSADVTYKDSLSGFSYD